MGHQTLGLQNVARQPTVAQIPSMKTNRSLHCPCVPCPDGTSNARWVQAIFLPASVYNLQRCQPSVSMFLCLHPTVPTACFCIHSTMVQRTGLRGGRLKERGEAVST